ncbi:DUF305 domain-containing protein [Streptomyces actuosus]|uniref:DUF305 domain-containing protein n=1 Tax=Streptomyces actuosus TaxID=1885 RepID=UPI0027DAA1ED|nr:DUF305 domain-containing protein [Streptomyces actuosus]
MHRRPLRDPPRTGVRRPIGIGALVRGPGLTKDIPPWDPPPTATARHARARIEEARHAGQDRERGPASSPTLPGRLDLWGLPEVSPQPPTAWTGMRAMPARGDGALVPGMATDRDPKRLGPLSGRQAEVLSLRLMTDHHRGGVHMAEGCVARCTVGAAQRPAQRTVDAQKSETGLMADLLRKRGAAPKP